LKSLSLNLIHGFKVRGRDLGGINPTRSVLDLQMVWWLRSACGNGAKPG
jgi:hypothetical protein